MTNYADLAASDGSGEPVRITLTAPRSIGSTTLTGNTPTNWPTGTYIATTGTLQSNGTLDPTTAQVFYGTVSGSNLSITSFAAGYSDLGNSIGDVVVIKPTTEWANLASQGVQSTTQFPANFANFVEPAGGVWTQSSGLIGQATAGNVWYNGTRSAMPLVTSNTFTASKDTYVDFNPSSSAFTYVPETNGAAEPAVTANCVRVAKVVTGASAITLISQTQYTSPRTGVIPYNPYKFSVYLANTQSITQGTPTKVLFDTKLFDTGSNFDTVTNHRFIAPVAGFYWFAAATLIGPVGGVNDGVTVYTLFYKNGSLVLQGGTQTTGVAAAEPQPGISGLLQLAASDYVEFYVTQGDNTSRSLATGLQVTYFHGFLVSEN